MEVGWNWFRAAPSWLELV